LAWPLVAAKTDLLGVRGTTMQSRPSAAASIATFRNLSCLKEKFITGYALYSLRGT
jgi:hypothetical protein